MLVLFFSTLVKHLSADSPVSGSSAPRTVIHSPAGFRRSDTQIKCQGNGSPACRDVG